MRGRIEAPCYSNKPDKRIEIGDHVRFKGAGPWPVVGVFLSPYREFLVQVQDRQREEEPSAFKPEELRWVPTVVVKVRLTVRQYDDLYDGKEVGREWGETSKVVGALRDAVYEHHELERQEEDQ